MELLLDVMPCPVITRHILFRVINYVDDKCCYCLPDIHHALRLKTRTMAKRYLRYKYQESNGAYELLKYSYLCGRTDYERLKVIMFISLQSKSMVNVTLAYIVWCDKTKQPFKKQHKQKIK